MRYGSGSDDITLDIVLPVLQWWDISVDHNTWSLRHLSHLPPHMDNILSSHMLSGL
jgi:hypothetical protein